MQPMMQAPLYLELTALVADRLQILQYVMRRYRHDRFEISKLCGNCIRGIEEVTRENG